MWKPINYVKFDASGDEKIAFIMAWQENFVGSPYFLVSSAVIAEKIPRCIWKFFLMIRDDRRRIRSIWDVVNFVVGYIAKELKMNHFSLKDPLERLIIT